MPYRSVTAAIAVIYVAASLPVGGYAVWAVMASYGARHSSDGLTQAQFPFSVFVLSSSAAAILLLASLVAVAWLHGPLLLGLAVVALVTASAVVITFQSPAWTWPEASDRVVG